MDIFASLSIFGVLLTVIFGGYLCAFMLQIINSAALGKKELPSWPDFTDIWDSMLGPLFMVLGVFVISFSPALVYFFFLMPRGASPLILPLLIGIGLFYQPMGLLAVAICNSVGALSPAFIFPSIFRVFGKYIVTCAVLLVLAGAKTLFTLLVSFIPFVNAILSNFLLLYFLTVQMRLLGLIYATSEKALEWE